MDKLGVKVKSLGKALDILNHFTEYSELGVTELANIMDLSKSNIHNILSTFQAYGYLEQDQNTDKYRLGTQIMELYRTLGDRYSIRQIALPFMQDIANITKERVYLGVPQDNEVLYLEAAYPAEIFSLSRSLLGVRAPMYCTGVGKAMLAFFSEPEVDRYLQRELKPYTQNTIIDATSLKEELAKIRTTGYSTDNMEHEFGVKCVAMPILDRRGVVCAAISINGPSLRFEDEIIEKHATVLKENIKVIEGRI